MVSTFLDVEAEGEGLGDLRGGLVVLEMGCSVKVIVFHYAALIIERLAMELK